MEDLSLLLIEHNKEEKAQNILMCNEVSNCYGVALKKVEVMEIMETQRTSLFDLGRIEFEGTIIEQIIYAFCDSKFISKYEYANTINQLVEIFYSYRSELDELLTDEEIIGYLKRAFNGPCQGALDWLESGQLEKIMKALLRREDIYEDDEYGCF